MCIDVFWGEGKCEKSGLLMSPQHIVIAAIKKLKRMNICERMFEMNEKEYLCIIFLYYNNYILKYIFK